jgi:hypothetical protein
MDTLGDAASFYRDHLSKLLLDALGSAAAQVALATLGAHQNTRPGDAEAFRGRLMGLEFVFSNCLLARHVYNSFSHKTPGGQRYKPYQACSPVPAG